MRATRYDRYRCAQNADHFAHNSPFSAFFAEVVCTLGMTPPRTVISPPPEGGLHDQYGGHRKTCWARLWNPWTAVPVGGGEAWPGFEATHPATHSDTSAAGVEGAGGHGGPGCGARGRRQGLAGLRDDAPSEARGADGERAGRPRGGRRSGGRPGPKAPGTPAEHTKYRPMGGCRNPAGVKGAGGQCCGARGWRQGLAGLRDDAPSEARGADGERAGRRPRAHKAARRANCLYSPPTPGSGRPV